MEAIVQLEDEIKFTDKYKSNICLPDSAHTVSPTQNCYINGWGFTDAARKKRPEVLQSSMLKLIPRATCNLKETYNGAIRKGELCAANARGTTISCDKDKGGDEGSSVVCRTNDMWYAVGIAIDNSWACRLGQNYGVYTDTAFHKPWIIKTVLDDSL